MEKKYLRVSDYFIYPDYRCKSEERLDDGSGVKITWGYQKSLANISNYMEWLHIMISMSEEIGVSLIKMAKLMREGVIKKPGWVNDQDFLDILIMSIENGGKEEIGETILSRNSRSLDK